ncbi:MAG: ComF family protein, partial [Coprobacillus cateniformis]
GLYDHALKDAFLCLFQCEFDNQYKDYIIVVAPSSQEDNELRGFAPVETIAQTFSSQIFNGLYKKEKYKQSDLSYQERKRVARRIDIRDGEKLKGKKVLILDDVITSGSTLHSCLLLVLAQEPQSVELLALSTKNIGRIEVC